GAGLLAAAGGPVGVLGPLLLHLAGFVALRRDPRRRLAPRQRPRRVADHLSRRLAAAAVAGTAGHLVAVRLVVAGLALGREAADPAVRDAPTRLVEVVAPGRRNVVRLLVELLRLLQQVADQVLEGARERHFRDLHRLAVERFLQHPT